MAKNLENRLAKLEAVADAKQQPLRIIRLCFVKPRAEPGALLAVSIGFGPDAVRLERGADETEEQLWKRAEAACQSGINYNVLTEDRQYIPTAAHEAWEAKGNFH
jgi:hypothetical protein